MGGGDLGQAVVQPGGGAPLVDEQRPHPLLEVRGPIDHVAHHAELRSQAGSQALARPLAQAPQGQLLGQRGAAADGEDVCAWHGEAQTGAFRSFVTGPTGFLRVDVVDWVSATLRVGNLVGFQNSNHFWAACQKGVTMDMSVQHAVREHDFEL